MYKCKPFTPTRRTRFVCASPSFMVRWQLILSTSVRVSVLIVGHGYPCEAALGLFSLSGQTTHHKDSWSHEAAIFGFGLQSLWNLTGTPAAGLPRCLSRVIFAVPHTLYPATFTYIIEILSNNVSCSLMWPGSNVNILVLRGTLARRLWCEVKTAVTNIHI